MLAGNEAGLTGYWKLDNTATVDGNLVTPDVTSNHNDLAVQGNTSFTPFTQTTAVGGKLVALQPVVDIGIVDITTSQLVKVPVDNSGVGPVAAFANTVKVINPGFTDTLVTSIVFVKEGPNIETMFFPTNSGYLTAAVTGIAKIPHNMFAGGNILSWIYSDGIIAFNKSNSSAGFFYPRNSGKTPIFAAGLRIGAIVNGDVRTAGINFEKSEFRPGNIVGGVAANPNDPVFRLYKIRKGDNAGNNPDYATWPSSLGAPVNKDGTPQLIGDETLWCVYNDLDVTAHDNLYKSEPLGAEVQQTVWGYNQSDVLGNTMFVRYRIINKSSTTWTNANFSIFTDADLGNSLDDLVGVDVSRDLAFTYNGSDDDGSSYYGTRPPAVGQLFLEGAFPKAVRSFSYYTNNEPALHDPTNAQELYNYQLGVKFDGTPFFDPVTGAPSPFPLNGDPVSGTGWLNTIPGDQRMMLTTGPKTIAPGDTVTISFVYLISHGENRLQSVSLLKSAAEEVKSFYQRMFQNEIPFGILRISDIIPDQGKQVRIEWTAHPLDVPNDNYQITSYEIYRKIDQNLTNPSLKISSQRSLKTAELPSGKWELVSQASANQVPRYFATVPTLMDSTKNHGSYYSQFFISARTMDADFHFETAADSGYSLDNIAPAIPENLTARIESGNIVINWSPSNAVDLEYYAIYRSTDPGFKPVETTPYAYATDTSFVDNQATYGTTYYFKISALDISGNESLYSPQLAINTATGVEITENTILEFALYQNYPNPFNPSTKIEYRIASSEFVILKVYDVLGREVATLVNQEQSAGDYKVEFQGKNLPSGLYIYRLQAGLYSESKKMLLTK